MADSFYTVLPSLQPTGTVLHSITGKAAFTRTLESGIGESHLSKYLSSTMDPLAIMVSLGNIEIGPFNITWPDIETVGDLVFATHLTLEKKAAEHGLNLSDHITISFFPRGTLSKIEIRTFRGSTLGFNTYLARKMGLLTDNGSVPADYVDCIGTTLWSFSKRALFV